MNEGRLVLIYMVRDLHETLDNFHYWKDRLLRASNAEEYYYAWNKMAIYRERFHAIKREMRLLRDR